MKGSAEELNMFGYDGGVVGREDGGGDDEGVRGVGPVVVCPRANDARVGGRVHSGVNINGVSWLSQRVGGFFHRGKK